MIKNFKHLSRRQAALFSTFMAVFGVAIVVRIFASGAPLAFEPEAGTLSGAAVMVRPSGASGGAVQFGGTTPTPTPAGCVTLSDIPAGYPNNCTTGYKAAPDYPGSLHSCGAITSNTTYNFCDFPGGNQYVTGNNITFHGCRFHGTSVQNALVILKGDNITFDYVSIEPDVAFVHNTPAAFNSTYQYGIEADGGYGSFAGQLTVDHTDIWGFGNAIDTAGSTQAKPQVFRDNWIHDPSNDGIGITSNNYHVDGIGNESGRGTGSYITIDHNTILSPGNTNGIAFQQGAYDHISMTNNMLGGYNMMVAVIGGTYITFTDNTYNTLYKPAFGPLYGANFWNGTGDLWRRNKWLVPTGAAWGAGANSGKYWLPCTYTIDTGPVTDSYYTDTNDYDGVNLPAACH